MPFEQVSPTGGFIGTPERPDLPETEGPDFVNDLIPAAFRTENIIGSYLNSTARNFSDAPFDPDLDVYSEIQGTKYEPYGDDFAEVRNRAHLEAMKIDIDRELSDRETLAQGGVPGMVAAMGAGFFDLPTLIPGAAAIRTARGGYSVLKTAAATSAIGAASAGVSEFALHQTQATRTSTETGFAIAGSAVLAGILGGAIGASLKKTDAASIAEKLERDFIIPGDNEADVFMPGAVRAPFDADAAASRAQEKGFTIDAFHGTRSNFDLENITPAPSRGGLIYVSQDKSAASKFGEQVGETIAEKSIFLKENPSVLNGDGSINADELWKRRFDLALEYDIRLGSVRKSPEELALEFREYDLPTGGRVFPVRVKAQNTHPEMEWRAAEGLGWEHFKGRGYDSVWISDETGKSLAVFDADQIRSKFDEFSDDGPPPSGRAASLGAASYGSASNALKSAFGFEKAFANQDPMLRLQVNGSEVSRRIVNEMPESPLTFEKNAKGFESAAEGSQLGTPGTVEGRIRLWQYPLANTLKFVDDQFVQYRTGGANRAGKRLNIAIKDQFSTPTDLTHIQFKHEVARAMRRNDEHEIPEVAKAAKEMRKNIFEPLKDEAIAAKLLDEGVDVDTALSYLMRVYNKEKIIKERPGFKSQIQAHLKSEEAINTQVEAKVRPLMDEHKVLKGKIANLEKRIEGRSRTAEKTEARREEMTRLNKFAFQRADRLSQPLDDLRTNIDTIGEQIQDQLDKIDEFTVQIRAEREDIPGLIEIEARLQKLSRGLSGVNREARLIDVVEAADEISQGIESLKDSVKPVLSSMRAEARGLREGQDVLKELEKTRAKLGKEIQPFRKELARLRKELRQQEKRKKLRAQEGAVFETKIRGRGNSLADQASGRNAEIETLKLDLETRQARFDQIQNEIEQHILEFKGKTTSKAKSAVGSREKAELDRFSQTMTLPNLKGADKSVIKAARQILKRTTRTDADISERAEEIIDRIIGTPDGRLPYDANKGHTSGKPRPGVRGPMKAREFNIPDEMIEDFLENDIEFLARVYTRSMAPDIELTKRFGSIDMTDQLKEVAEHYNARVEKAKTPKEREKLQKMKNNEIRDISAIRDRLRGTYAVPENPEALAYRVGAMVRSLNYMRLLGGMTISAIPDMSRVVMTHGLTNTFRDGLVPLFRDFKATRLAAEEVKMAGTALDMILDSRAMALADVMDDFGRMTKFERGVQATASKFGVVSLMAPWNAALKQMTGMVTMTRMLRDIESIASGKATTKQIENLAAGGISETNARRIAEQFSKHGEKRGGVWLAQTADWDEGSREAIEAFRTALSRDVDRTIVTPGQDRPLWMSRPMGQVIGQFKSFAVASMQRTLISGLQQRDMGVLSGAALAVALGGLTHIIKQKQNGHDVNLNFDNPDHMKQFMVNAVDRSGLTGWLMDANSMTEKLTRGGVGLSRITGKPVSRYAQRNLLGSLMGPTAGTLEDFARIAGAATNQDFKQSDVRAMRRLMPYQNIFYVRKMFDTAQENIESHLGVR